MKPYFSVIIPVYNKENHIKATLESVLNQMFQDFEIIIVNDGSTDHSEDIILQITDKRIHLHTIKNHGVSYARNYGISKATSDLIVFLDADDFWEPFHLEDLKALHEIFPYCGLYCKAYLKKLNNIKLIPKYKGIPQTKDWMGIIKDYYEASSINAVAWTSAVMIPKNILDKVGGFDEKITLGAGEDTDLWIRIALQQPVAFYNKISAIHNLDTENRISNSNTNIRQFIDLDQYEDIAKSNLSLKKYLDLNRYAIALQYKISGNYEKAQFYIKNIDLKNLNRKQRILIYLSPFLLKIMSKIKRQLLKYGLKLSSF